MGHYLVTGCAGFIANKVAEFLLADGHTPSTELRAGVVGVDNLNDAYDVRLKQWQKAWNRCTKRLLRLPLRLRSVQACEICGSSNLQPQIPPIIQIWR
jgi:nucleoside-diphosphate-sugar epimerase